MRRTVDDLIDDWHRAGNVLRYEDITRLASKRALSAQQTAAIVAALQQCGVDISGLVTRADGDAEGSSDRPKHERRTSVDSDALRAYCGEVRRYPLIWAEDEVRLGRQIQTGLRADALLADTDRLATLPPAERAALHSTSVAGRRAHREMVCANLRLVVSIAKNRSYERSGVEFLDRIQDGNAGLMHAADKFDPTLGYKFSTYATWWIRQAIDRGIADRGRLVRLPVHVHERIQALRRAQRSLGDCLGREATLAELSQHLGWDAGTVQALLDWSRPLVSLDVRVGTEGDITLGDLLSNEADVDGRGDPVDCVIEAAWSRDLDTVIDQALDVRAREVIRRRYGLRGIEKETLEDIGKHFGLTRERIRQIETKAMDELRSDSGVDQLRIYLFDDLPEQPQSHEQRVPAKPRRGCTKVCTSTTTAKQATTPKAPGVARPPVSIETTGRIVRA